MPIAHFVVVVNSAAWTNSNSKAVMVILIMSGGWNKDASVGKHMGHVLIFLNRFISSLF